MFNIELWPWPQRAAMPNEQWYVIEAYALKRDIYEFDFGLPKDNWEMHVVCFQ